MLINVRWWNATAFYAVNIGRILKQNGHRVTIGCSKDYPAYQQAAACGLNVVDLKFDGLNLPGRVKDFFRLLHVIRTNRVDIIDAHRSEDQSFALLAKLVSGVRLVVTRGDQRPISRHFLGALKYRWSDAVILTCRSILEKNRHVFEGIGNTVRVIYGSVDEARFKPGRPPEEVLKKYGIPAGRRIVGLVGRLSPVKGHATFIKAAAAVLQRHPEVQFVIAGKEVEIKTRDITGMLDQLNIADHFTLLPEIDDIVEVMNTFDIGVVASTGSETISRVLLEYMVLQKPVIGTRINAIGEIIQPGVNGALVAPDDPAALADEIKKILADESLITAFGRESLRLYRENYSEERFYENTIEIFEQVLFTDP